MTDTNSQPNVRVRVAGRRCVEQPGGATAGAGTCVLWRADPDGTQAECWVWDGQAAPLAACDCDWLDSVHEDDRDQVLQAWAAALSSRQPSAFEYRRKRSDGVHGWARNRVVPLRDGEGAILGWIGAITDIERRTLSDQAVREQIELLRLAIEATGLGIWNMELPSHRTEWSGRLKTLAGLPLDAEINDDTFYALVHPDDRDAVESALTRAVRSQARDPYSVAYRIRRPNTGEERWWEEWARLVTDAEGKPARLVGAIQDITERKAVEIERQNSERRWRLALRAGKMVAWEHTRATGITSASDSYAELLGIRPGDIAGFLACVHPADRGIPAGLFETPPNETVTLKYRYCHPDGQELWLQTSAMRVDDDAGPSRIVGVTSDITEREEAELKLVYAASHDGLTDLLNRSALQTALDRAIAKARMSGQHVTLIMIDVDHFKEINDSLGHDAGDCLLRSAAERLSAAVGDLGVVARLGGDEFAVLVDSLPTRGEQERLAGKLLEELRKGFVYQEKTRRIMASLGIATFPDHADNSVDLLKYADLALYDAKSAGRARLSWFQPKMQRLVDERAALVTELQRAIALGEFVPFYQPKVDFETGAIVGFEALARWIHPTRGVLTPQIFGVAFEEGELAIAIGKLMLGQILADMARWTAEGLDFGRIALNLSSFEFAIPDFSDNLVSQLANAGVDCAALEVEVTETVLLDNRGKNVATTLQRLHGAGVKVALDDFGTGYASLTHLKRFPVDELKIDRSFVRNIESSVDDATIVGALTALASGLGLTVVAEGVETAAQAAKLHALGCRFGQGYLFGRPMAGTRVPQFLRKTRQWEAALPFYAPTRRSRAV